MGTTYNQQEIQDVVTAGSRAEGTSAQASRRRLPSTPACIDESLLRRAAAAHCTLLITGETGVGKGHLAKWVHRHSPRRDRPFIPVNCGAIPETLIDSQLFGHTKGAFSGATSAHKGLVRAADSGTLLLDEIAELPLSAQTRLLRLLQEREVQPVGQSEPSLVDVRVIAATNIGLEQAVKDKKFREDLYFRLNVIRLPVPPLRERLDEFEAMICHFNSDLARFYKQDELVFHDDALQALRQYDWPGNIRQLRTMIERLHVLSPDKPITLDVLVEIGQIPVARPRVNLDDLKVEQVRRVLAEVGGSVGKASAILGVHRSTIYRWLQQHATDAEIS